MDATLKEVNIKRSIRKFFIDEFDLSPPTQHVYFDFLYDVPKDSQGNKLTDWIIIYLEDKNLDTVADLTVSITMFTRNDKEGDRLSELVDVIHATLRDENTNTGNRHIPLYDTEASPWTVVGNIVPIRVREGETDIMPDKTKFKVFTVFCKWGAKA